MRVIVCGARNWLDPTPIFRELDALAAVDDDLALIEGCAHGVDELAGAHEPAFHEHGYFNGGWAWWRLVPAIHVPADWHRLGRAAGPLRNRSMLARGPDLVLAFHPDIDASKGTADMVRVARASGVEVRLFGA